MKLSCTQENLLQGLNIVSHITEKSSHLPILDNVLLRAERDGLQLITTNLEIAITTRVRCKVDELGLFTVRAKLLSDFVNTLKKEKITLLLEGTQLHIEGENHQTTIKGVEATDFPIVPPVEAGYEFRILSAGLSSALAQTLFAVSNEQSRPELCGVLLQMSPSACVFAATDSFRLAEKIITIKKSPVESERRAIIPSRTIQELVRALDAEGADEVLIRVSDNQVFFGVGQTEITSRIITGEYPDYKQIIPAQFQNSIDFSVADMVRAVKTTSLFCKQGINDVRLALTKKSKSISVSAENMTFGKNTSELPTTSDDQELDIVFNYKYLLDGLARILDTAATLKTNEATSPALLTPAKDKSFLYVIMPIRQ